MAKKIPYYYALSTIIIVALLVAVIIYAQWSEPTLPPPQGNVPAPINVGPNGQSKAGGLILNTGGAVTGLVIDQGNVGIGMQTPGYKLDVAGPLRLRPTTAPIGANGLIYYDSGTNKFRCYQNGAWTDCIGAGGGLPPGTSDQTLRHDGTNWAANSFLRILSNGLVAINQQLDIGAPGLGTLNIGTTGFGGRLNIEAGSNFLAARVVSAGITSLEIDSGRVGIGASPDSSQRLKVTGSTYFNGNVGIGAPAGTDRLTVSGSTNMTGDLNVGGSITLGGEARDAWPQEYAYTCENSYFPRGDCFGSSSARYSNDNPPLGAVCISNCGGTVGVYRNPSSCPTGYVEYQSYCDGDCGGDDSAVSICRRQ